MTTQQTARELVTVEGKSFVGISHEGINVVTLNQIDEVHNRPLGTARYNFNYNKKQFSANKDYFMVDPYQAKEYGIRANRGLVLLTESGYLMIAKTFTDDLSWKVQRQLVDGYFHAKRQEAPTIPTDPVLAMLTVMQDLRKEQISLATQNNVLATGLAEARHDINKIKEERRLENWQQASLLKAVNYKVDSWGALHPDRSIRKAYMAIWRSVKERFSVPRYNEIPAGKYLEALTFINNFNTDIL